MRFTLDPWCGRVGPGCGRVVTTVARGCRFLYSRRSGIRGCHLGWRLLPGAFACTTTTAASTTPSTPAATAALGALGTTFRRRCCGSASCRVVTGRVGDVSVAIRAIDDLALGTVALSSALGKPFAPTVRGCLVAATAVAVAIPIGVIPPTIAVAAVASALALAPGTIGIPRVARMIATSFASLSFITPRRT